MNCKIKINIGGVVKTISVQAAVESDAKLLLKSAIDEIIDTNGEPTTDIGIQLLDVMKTTNEASIVVPISSIEPDVDETQLHKQGNTTQALSTDTVVSNNASQNQTNGPIVFQSHDIFDETEINSLSSQLSSLIGMNVSKEFEFELATGDGESHYDSKTNKIIIYDSFEPGITEGDDLLRIKRKVAHEYVHMCTKNMTKNSDDCNKIIKKIESAYKSAKLSSDFNDILSKTKNKNKYSQASELIADLYTKMFMNEIDFGNKSKKSIINQVKSAYKTTTDDLFIEEDGSLNYTISSFFRMTTLEKLKNAWRFNGKKASSIQAELKKLYDIFEQAKLSVTAANKTDYNMSYSDPSTRESTSNFDISLGRLMYGDVVLVPMNLKFNSSTGVFELDKNSEYSGKNKYMPVISSSAEGVKVAIKKKDGYTYATIPNDLISAYRQFESSLIDELDTEYVQEIVNKYHDDVKFLEQDDDSDEKGVLKTIYYSEGKKAHSYVSKKNAIEVNISNNEYSRDLLKSLSPGSVVYFKIKNKKISAPVVKTMSGSVIVANTADKPYTIPFKDITSVLLRKSDLEGNEAEDSMSASDLKSYYSNKKLGYSNMEYVDKNGSFKKTPKSMYDYNQIFGDNDNDHRLEFDAWLTSVYDEARKKKIDNIDELIAKKNKNDKMVKYYNVYKSRKALLDSLSPDKTYAMFNYVGSDGGVYTGKGKVVFASKDTMTVLSYTKNGHQFYHTINIRNNVPRKNSASLKRIIYDNSFEYDVANGLKKQSAAIKARFDALTGTKNNTRDSYAALEAAIGKQFGDNNSKIESLSDNYTYMYKDDYNAKQWLYALSRLSVGDLVFEEAKNGKRYPKAVIDIKPNGDIILGSIMSGSIDNGTSKYDGNLAKTKLVPDKISAIGGSVRDNDEIGIKANQYFSYIYNKKIEDLMRFDGYKAFNKKESAEKYAVDADTVIELIEYSKKVDSSEAIIYIPSGSDVSGVEGKGWTATGKTKFGIDRSRKGSKKFILRNKNTEYGKIKDANIDDIQNRDIVNLKIQKGNDVKYVTAFVSNILKTNNGKKVRVTSTYIDKNNNIAEVMYSITEDSEIEFDIFRKGYDSRKSIDNSTTENTGKTKKTIKNSTTEFAVTNKPTKKSRFNFSKNTNDYTKSVDSYITTSGFVDGLKTKYDIDMSMLSSSEIAKIFGDEFARTRAFVIGNEIVINSDLSSIAEPIHELSHIILAQLKTADVSTYNQLIDVAKNHPDFNIIAKEYKNLPYDNLCEEVFATIFGEYYRGVLRSRNTEAWSNNNKSFFQRIVSKIKEFFADLFGIDIKDIDINDNMIPYTSVEKIMNDFGGNLINGKFDYLVKDYKSQWSNKITSLKQDLVNDGLLLIECFE